MIRKRKNVLFRLSKLTETLYGMFLEPILNVKTIYYYLKRNPAPVRKDDSPLLKMIKLERNKAQITSV